MKKIFLFVLVLSFICELSFAAKVSKSEAKKAAVEFYKGQYNKLFGSNNSAPFKTVNEYVISENGIDLIYVFNFENMGYILMSADNNINPVLAYSFSSQYDPTNLINPFRMWLEYYKNQIKSILVDKNYSNKEMQNQWEALKIAKINKSNLKSVPPLITSKWNQGQVYNVECPSDTAGPGGKCLTGCVATCLGQLMYYYRFPQNGSGSFSYTHPVYGNLSADFGNTTYEWDAMCDIPSKPNGAIGKLLAHCGIGVSMQYGPNSSGMYNHSAADVLKTYFKYSNEVRYVFRDSTNLRWDSLIVAQLDKKMPLYYAGWSVPNINGHAFVCDGYQDTTYFHFNFGWGGSYDGYFYLNALSPGGSNFNLAQELIINIYPDTSLYSYPYYCNGQKILTSLEGSIEDGSGPINYYSQTSSCSWLISPSYDSISSIVLKFGKFKTTPNFGVIRIYNGSTVNDPLIATYSGSQLPNNITINNKYVLVTFNSYSDTIGKEGFLINYSTNLPNYCSSFKLINTSSGSFSDGSGSYRYNPNTTCKWLIYPSNPASSITLNFNNFDTELNDDILKIKGISSVVVLATFSGNNFPQSFTINGNQTTLEWITNYKNEFQGWDISFTTSGVGVNTYEKIKNIIVYPNPSSELLNISLNSIVTDELLCQIYSIEGKLIYSEKFEIENGANSKTINISNLSKGFYLLKLVSKNGENYQQKISKI